MAAPSADALQRNLEALPPASRQAFLLRTVEDFSLDEVASILQVQVDEAARLLDTAGREIADQVATSVLIIEDEPIIALDIESMVRDLGHEVTGVARTHREAVEMVKARPPGLVLADIQLADGSSGLEAVNEILTRIDTPVIFITAFPERLLTGEKPEPAFLVTKPFRPETVKATICSGSVFRPQGRPQVRVIPRPRGQAAARSISSSTTPRNVSKLNGLGIVKASSNSPSTRSGEWPVAKAKGIALACKWRATS